MLTSATGRASSGLSAPPPIGSARGPLPGGIRHTVQLWFEPFSTVCMFGWTGRSSLFRRPMALHAPSTLRPPARHSTVNMTGPEGSVPRFPLGWMRVCSPAKTHGTQRGRATIAVSFKGTHVPQDIMLMCVRWYAAYPLSDRHIEELLEERGVSVDHATIEKTKHVGRVHEI
jgi:hypothetical protein